MKLSAAFLFLGLIYGHFAVQANTKKDPTLAKIEGERHTKRLDRKPAIPKDWIKNARIYSISPKATDRKE